MSNTRQEGYYWVKIATGEWVIVQWFVPKESDDESPFIKGLNLKPCAPYWFYGGHVCNGDGIIEINENRILSPDEIKILN